MMNDTQAGASSGTGRRRHLLDVIHNFDTAMLVTRTDDGALRSRPLMVAECGDDGTLYFATGAESGKVRELDADAHVNVTLQGDKQYASISGRGEILRDPALIDRLWSEAWKVWFPEGKNDPSLCILAVHPDGAELWDNTGPRGLRYVLESARAYLAGRKPRMTKGQNARVDGRELSTRRDERPGDDDGEGSGRWRALAAGLSGALALNLVHETARRWRGDAPRMDRVGAKGLVRAVRAAGGNPPQGLPLYLTALGGDVLANTLYYAAAFGGRPRRPWTRGLVTGTLAGIGAVILPPRLGLAPPRRARRPRSHGMTVAWYTLGGLAAAACYSLMNRSRR
jgi:general stress protein 26